MVDCTNQHQCSVQLVIEPVYSIIPDMRSCSTLFQPEKLSCDVEWCNRTLAYPSICNLCFEATINYAELLVKPFLDMNALKPTGATFLSLQLFALHD